MTRTRLQKTRHGSLAKYNPEKGLKKIALLEGVEKYFARAKDASKLQISIREKLEAQAEFVSWWDTYGPGTEHGGDRKSGSRKSKSATVDFDPESLKRPVCRWRQKLIGDGPAVFERTYEQALAKYTKILEFDSTPHVSQNSGENEWYTPENYIEAARAVLGDIDLDPASSDKANAIVKAAQIFTLADNGLHQPWHGRVWMNPPYAYPAVEEFCEKLAGCIIAGDVTAAVVLVNNATETGWFTRIARVSKAICFPTGRVKFWSPTKDTAAPLQGQAVLYAGPEVDTFCVEFRAFGILARIEP